MRPILRKIGLALFTGWKDYQPFAIFSLYKPIYPILYTRFRTIKYISLAIFFKPGWIHFLEFFLQLSSFHFSHNFGIIRPIFTKSKRSDLYVHNLSISRIIGSLSLGRVSIGSVSIGSVSIGSVSIGSVSTSLIKRWLSTFY